MSERTRSTPLVRILLSGEVSGEAPRELNLRERFDRWMVNERSRRLFVGSFILVHCLIYGFGFMNYQLKDSLTQARSHLRLRLPHRPLGGPRPPPRRGVHSLPSMLHTHLSRSPDASEWDHPF